MTILSALSSSFSKDSFGNSGDGRAGCWCLFTGFSLLFIYLFIILYYSLLFFIIILLLFYYYLLFIIIIFSVVPLVWYKRELVTILLALSSSFSKDSFGNSGDGRASCWRLFTGFLFFFLYLFIIYLFFIILYYFLLFFIILYYSLLLFYSLFFIIIIRFIIYYNIFCGSFGWYKRELVTILSALSSSFSKDSFGNSGDGRAGCWCLFSGFFFIIILIIFL